MAEVGKKSQENPELFFRGNGDPTGYSLMLDLFTKGDFHRAICTLDLHKFRWEKSSTGSLSIVSPQQINQQGKTGEFVEKIHFSTSEGSILVYSNGFFENEEEHRYFFGEELRKAFDSPLIENNNLQSRDYFAPFKEFKFSYPVLPCFEFCEESGEFIVEITKPRGVSPEGADRFIRIANVQSIELDFSQYYWFGREEKELELELGFWAKNLEGDNLSLKYYIPVFFNDSTQSYAAFIEIIGGKAEMIEHNLWQ